MTKFQHYGQLAMCIICLSQVWYSAGQGNRSATECRVAAPARSQVARMCYNSMAAGVRVVFLDTYEAGEALPPDGAAQCKCFVTVGKTNSGGKAGMYGFAINPLLTETMSSDCGTKISIHYGSRGRVVKCGDLLRRMPAGSATITLSRDAIAPPGGYEYGYCWAIYSLDSRNISLLCHAVEPTTESTRTTTTVPTETPSHPSATTNMTITVTSSTTITSPTISTTTPWSTTATGKASTYTAFTVTSSREPKYSSPSWTAKTPSHHPTATATSSTQSITTTPRSTTATGTASTPTALTVTSSVESNYSSSSWTAEIPSHPPTATLTSSTPSVTTTPRSTTAKGTAAIHTAPTVTSSMEPNYSSPSWTAEIPSHPPTATPTSSTPSVTITPRSTAATETVHTHTATYVNSSMKPNCSSPSWTPETYKSTLKLTAFSKRQPTSTLTAVTYTTTTTSPTTTAVTYTTTTASPTTTVVTYTTTTTASPTTTAVTYTTTTASPTTIPVSEIWTSEIPVSTYSTEDSVVTATAKYSSSSLPPETRKSTLKQTSISDTEPTSLSSSSFSSEVTSATFPVTEIFTTENPITKTTQGLETQSAVSSTKRPTASTSADARFSSASTGAVTTLSGESTRDTAPADMKTEDRFIWKTMIFDKHITKRQNVTTTTTATTRTPRDPKLRNLPPKSSANLSPRSESITSVFTASGFTSTKSVPFSSLQYFTPINNFTPNYTLERPISASSELYERTTTPKSMTEETGTVPSETTSPETFTSPTITRTSAFLSKITTTLSPVTKHTKIDAPEMYTFTKRPMSNQSETSRASFHTTTSPALSVRPTWTSDPTETTTPEEMTTQTTSVESTNITTSTTVLPSVTVSSSIASLAANVKTKTAFTEPESKPLMGTTVSFPYVAVIGSCVGVVLTVLVGILIACRSSQRSSYTMNKEASSQPLPTDRTVSPDGDESPQQEDTDKDRNDGMGLSLWDTNSSNDTSSCTVAFGDEGFNSNVVPSIEVTSYPDDVIELKGKMHENRQEEAVKQMIDILNKSEDL